MKIEIKKLKDLNPAPYNPRQSTEREEKNLKASLEKFGVVEPIIFNNRTGFIVGGHFRVRELKKLGYKEIECVIVDLSLEDERELNIRLNANTGQWDEEELKTNWDVKLLDDWGLDIDFTDDNDTTQKEVQELKPYVKTHVLLSFNPQDILKLKPFLDEILNIDGVEYEQSSN